MKHVLANQIFSRPPCCATLHCDGLQDPTAQQRQEALYNSTCAHAFAGDVEFAQVTLRGAPLLPLLQLKRQQMTLGGHCILMHLSLTEPSLQI